MPLLLCHPPRFFSLSLASVAQVSWSADFQPAINLVALWAQNQKKSKQKHQNSF